MEFLCILQPRTGLVPPKVVGSSHMFSYGRGCGIKAKTFGAMFSTGKGKGKDKVFRKRRLKNEEAETLLFFVITLYLSDSGMSPLFCFFVIVQNFIL